MFSLRDLAIYPGIDQHLRVKLCAWLSVQDGKVEPMG